MVLPAPIRSVCLFCGSSDAVDPKYALEARRFGEGLARAGLRLVYGGGGVGLMGAAARGAHDAGGAVLGVMPDFLRHHERLYDEVETRVVTTMHERKMIMFEESDAFVVAPGGIGTLEEVVELLSWKRLDLHDKPVIFLNLDGFWDAFFAMMRHSVEAGMTPASFQHAYQARPSADSVIESLCAMQPT